MPPPRDGNDGAQHGHDEEQVLHPQYVLVPDGQQHEHTQEGSAHEAHVLGHHYAQRGGEQVKISGRKERRRGG